MKIFKSKISKVILVILAIIIIIGAGAYGYIRYTLGKVTTVQITKNPQDLEVVPYVPSDSQGTQQKKPDVTNIALIGVDKKNPDGSQRSDTVIVASIDKEHKKIKLTSIMRDTYVEAPGDTNTKDGYTRMGHTYQDGGPELTIKAINKNFNLDVMNFVKVDFEGLTKIVDAIGGVKISVKDYELPSMRTVGITKAGEYNLNGKQALVYARIRHQGNADYERTERQRDVITAIFNKLTAQGTSTMASTITKLLPFVETSFSSNDLINMGYDILSSGTRKIEQSRVPFDGMSKSTTINGLYYLTFDKEPTIEKIHKFIYEQ